MAKIYGLYKGDKFISVGTMEEISKETGMDKKHLYTIKSKLKHGYKKGDYGLVIVEVGSTDEEEANNEVYSEL